MSNKIGRLIRALCPSGSTRLVLFIVLIICAFALLYNYNFLETENTTSVQIKTETNSEKEHSLEMVRARLMEMGINPDCDDGKTNLTVDWDHARTSYTCSEKAIYSDPTRVPEEYCETIPENYKAEKICMSETIIYSEPLPTYGMHRPVPPVYGEYKYLPVQRWLTSLEHGAIVALYHPCADTLEIQVLKNIVKKCLKRYIITASNRLEEERPLALLSWGCKLSMSYVNVPLAKQFIRENAIYGSEIFWYDGVFDDQLISKSELVSDYDNPILCPEQNISRWWDNQSD